MANRKTGIWLVGARGGVATTVALGLVGLKKGLTNVHGLVSELPKFDGLGLVDWRNIVVGGHEIRDTTLLAEAEKLRDTSRIVDDAFLSKAKTELKRIDANIRPGTLHNVGGMIESLADESLIPTNETPQQAVDRLKSDLNQFKEAHKLNQVIVVNVASTEPTVDADKFPAKWAALAKTLVSTKKCRLPASSLYAIAALDAGFPFLNFTPSLGSSVEAIKALAIERGVCHMGQDGKTGETLLKSTLAPMFAARNLGVMSWVGHNIFGNMDGKVLNDPENKQTKVVSKDKLLHQILGYDPQTLVGIEYIESLGDWKTAWDHIHFQGFLGTPMVMQFIWQGCDSILAAPLVIDLFRFTELASRHGEVGLLSFLSSFFKSPIDEEENDFTRQFLELEKWVEQRREP